MTHTPGEWKQRSEWNGIAIFNEQFGNIALVEGRRAETETISNARLIAASPELLEALEDLLDEVIELRNSEGYEVDTVPSIIKARAAIAKAKGE